MGTTIERQRAALSPELWQQLADHISQLVWMADGDGRPFWFNRRCFDYTGRTIDELEAEGWSSVLHPGDVERVRGDWFGAVASGKPYESIYLLRRADGAYRHFLARAEPLQSSEGGITHWFGTSTDITDQLAAEQAAREGSDRLRRATHAAGLFVWESNHTDGTTIWGDNAAQILGVEESELPRGPGTGTFFVADAEVPRIEQEFAEALAQRLPRANFEFTGKDGRRWSAECEIVYDAAGQAVRVFGATRDTTSEYREARRREYLIELDTVLREAAGAEQLMQDAAGLLAGRLGASRVAYADVDVVKGEYHLTVEVRDPDLPSALGLHRIDPDDAVFKTYLCGEMFIVEDHRADPRTRHYHDDPALAALEIGAVLDVPIFRREGLVGALIVHSRTPWRWSEEEIVLSRVTAERTWSFVERARAEQQVRFAEERYRAVFDSAAVGIARVSPDGPFLEINDRYCAILRRSRDDILAGGWAEITHADDLPGDVALVNRALAGEIDSFTLEKRYISPDGADIWVNLTVSAERHVDGSVKCFIAMVEDIAERKAAEAARAASEAQFRTTAEALPGLLFVTRNNGGNTYVNEAFRTYTGRPSEELLGDGWVEILHPDDADRGWALWNEAVETGQPYVAEYRFRRHDGAWRWHAVRALPVRSKDGQIQQWVGTCIDIHDRREVENSLRESEERYRTLFDSMEQGFAVIKVTFDEDDQPIDYRFNEINPAFTRQTGLAQDVLHRSVAEAVPGLEQGWFDLYADTVKSGQQRRYLGFAAPLGRWFEVYAFPIGGREENLVAILFTDVTERISQEQALKRSEQELRLRLNAIPQMVWSTLPDGYHDFYNNRWYEFTGTPLGSTDGDGWNGLFHPDDQAIAWQTWQESLAAGEPYEIEYRLRHHDGTYRWVLGRALPIRNEAGEIMRWMGTCTDIDDRIAAARALQEGEARLRAVIEAAPIGLVFADPSGQITGGNARVEEIIGHPVLPSEDFDHYHDWVSFHPDGRKVQSREYPLARVLSEGVERAELEVEYQRGDKRLSWIRFVASAIRDEQGALLGGVVASIDIDREKRLTTSLAKEVEKVVAERETAQEALRQSQKLEAMGQLTGGVAHDFNNLLTPIIGSLDLLQRKQILDQRTGRLVEGALASAEKARVLVQRLLAFARRQPLKPQPIDLRRVISEMGELVDSTSGPRIRVLTDAPDELPPALADGNQLEMALLNLSVNARDAMPEGGTLTIAARSEPEGAGGRLGLPGRPHVVLSVSDTGLGMDEETRRRAIEPFFSTKGVGKGTGLGLSMVHGLAAQLGGALDIRSAPGMGTSIELWLPLAGQVTPARDETVSEAEVHGAGTVLLVDDEELVRASTAGMLADLGYRVIEASCGEEAIALVDGGLKPDLLVTDQLMPGLSGTDLAVRLREGLDGLPVLVVSGYADLESLSPAFPHLSKPFRQAELAAALERLAA